jgi:hypothetical protein
VSVLLTRGVMGMAWGGGGEYATTTLAALPPLLAFPTALAVLLAPSRPLAAAVVAHTAAAAAAAAAEPSVGAHLSHLELTLLEFTLLQLTILEFASHDAPLRVTRPAAAAAPRSTVQRFRRRRGGFYIDASRWVMWRRVMVSSGDLKMFFQFFAILEIGKKKSLSLLSTSPSLFCARKSKEPHTQVARRYRGSHDVRIGDLLYARRWPECAR